MANEITVTIKVSVLKGDVSAVMDLANLRIDMTGTQLLHAVQNIGVTEEALQLGDVGAGGWFVAVNRDSTNFVEIRPNTAVADLTKLKPGEGCAFRLAADAVPYAIADTAAVDLEYLVIDD